MFAGRVTDWRRLGLHGRLELQCRIELQCRVELQCRIELHGRLARLRLRRAASLDLLRRGAELASCGGGAALRTSAALPGRGA